jgi:hypothetical protein
LRYQPGGKEIRLKTKYWWQSALMLFRAEASARLQEVGINDMDYETTCNDLYDGDILKASSQGD